MSYFEDFLKEDVIVEKPVKPTPKTPKTPKIDVISEETSEFEINTLMEDLAKTSDFKRMVYRAITGRVHRGSTGKLNQELAKLLRSTRKNT